MELAVEQREWVHRCETLASYADDDGIVCIPPVRGEAYGDLIVCTEPVGRRLWQCVVKRYPELSLLMSADHEGKTLKSWLREKFFHPALQVVPAPPLHLAHLGWPARWLRRPSQLSQARCQTTGDPDLHLSG